MFACLMSYVTICLDRVLEFVGIIEFLNNTYYYIIK